MHCNKNKQRALLNNTNGVHMFKIWKEEQKGSIGKGQLAIRLRDEEEDDESFSKTNVDYFFDQDTEELEGILNGNQVKLKIEKSFPDNCPFP